MAPRNELKSQLRLRNTVIDGKLDLSSSVLRSRLYLESCQLAAGVDLSGAQADTIVFRECDEIRDIEATGLRAERSLAIVDCEVRGAVTLIGARIGEFLSFAGSTIEGIGHGLAVSADLAQVGTSLDFSDVRALKTVRFGGVKVNGRLEFNGAELVASAGRDQGGCCVFADSIQIDGDVFFKEGFKSVGTVSMVQANVNGVLSFEGATLQATERGEAAGCSLRADGLRVGGNLFCRNGFNAQGAVRLKAASIEGEVDFGHSQLCAVNCGVDAGGALRGNAMKVARDFSCKGLSCTGRFELDGAGVVGRLDFCDAALSDGSLILAELEARELCVLWATPPGELNLADASVDIYRDTPRHLPLAPVSPLFFDEPPLTLRGFRYRTLANVGGGKERLAWIEAAQGRFYREPEVYAAVEREYRRQGMPNEARLVAIGRHRAARVSLEWWQTAWSFLLDYTVGFGYRLWGAAVWLVIAIVAGGALLSIAGEECFTAVQPDGMQPEFNPFVYAIDSTIPSLDVGQERFWVAEGWSAVVEIGLAGIGYALAAALIAGGASILTRDRAQ